ncbi:glycosyltransferase family 2 protein [Mesonia maritima]|uniref:GT2 family glycosyltransferase n=1 Tax=Mesonia maritima TaxID=1793873 RepID=A0ABU1K790_9FLAO|nr:glycosyltransferase family 2 protein [Mesonia maritima]MDR6301477.1 GT2 family glycosyltransferase [Mesonia maritima]
MQLSVIILNYKVPYYLLQCIESVQKAIAHLEAEIIVVDNNSKDESCKLVKKYFPDVSLIQNKKNEGFSKGNNYGVTLARGKYICLLNPDTVVAENVFEKTLAFAETKTDFGALGVKLIDGQGNFLPESKRNLPVPKVAFQKLIGNSTNYYSNSPADEVSKVAVLVGAFMLMQKKRYLEVGGLDEDYFMYGEDIDLSYKFLKAGYQNYYFGAQTVLHYKGESTVKDAEYRKRFYGAMKIFYRKHFNKNLFLNFFVANALQLAKIRHLFHKPIKKKKNQYQGEFLVSENDKFNLKTEVFSNLKKLNSNKAEKITTEHSLFIFDAETVDYKKIFSIMEIQKKGKNYFRIKPTNFNFIIGSDSSTGKGDVIKI